jgi:hypothetical protein
MSAVVRGRTRRPSLRRVAAAIAYWLAVLIVSALLVVALLWFLEGRDASSLDGTADWRATTASIAEPRAR